MLLLLVLLLAGCRAALAPLNEEEQEQALAPAEVALLRIATCYSGLPLVQDLTTAQSVANPGLTVDIIAGDTPSPAELIASGQADIALAPIPADGLTPPALPDAYQTYQPTLLAIDALGLMAHSKAAVRALTSEELARLFGGYVLDWKELDAGSGEPELVSLQAGTASRGLFDARLASEGQQLSSAALLLPDDRAVVDYLAKHQLAVGYASVANRDERVHLVALDGVLPTPKGVARGTYPYTWALYALVSPQVPAQAAQWLAFALSPTGQDLIAQRYTLPR